MIGGMNRRYCILLVCVGEEDGPGDDDPYLFKDSKGVTLIDPLFIGEVGDSMLRAEPLAEDGLSLCLVPILGERDSPPRDILTIVYLTTSLCNLRSNVSYR